MHLLIMGRMTIRFVWKNNHMKRAGMSNCPMMFQWSNIQMKKEKDFNIKQNNLKAACYLSVCDVTNPGRRTLRGGVLGWFHYGSKYLLLVFHTNVQTRKF